MLIKTLAGIALFAAAGGAVGYSQVLCPDGQCAITSTPYGGAVFGGLLGFALISGLSARPSSTLPPPKSEDDQQAPPD